MPLVTRARLVFTGLLAFVAGGPGAAQDTACDSLCQAAAELVARFELREGAAPVRESAGWQRPKKIVVADVPLADTLRTLAPGVEVVGVAGLRNFAGMARGRRGRRRADRPLHARDRRARHESQMDSAAERGCG